MAGGLWLVAGSSMITQCQQGKSCDAECGFLTSGFWLLNMKGGVDIDIASFSVR
jgi:hypothetical protein